MLPNAPWCKFPLAEETTMRGYFAIGAERISKPMNLGNLLRSAHAFGASFFFTIARGLWLVRRVLSRR